METAQPTLVDRLLWTAVLGVVTGVTALAASRLAAWGWTQIRKSPPPKPIGPLHSLAKNLGMGAVKGIGA